MIHDKRIKIWLIIIMGGCFCAMAALLCYSVEAINHVVINEVCSKNFSVICDERGNYADYIELYNPTAVPVSLTGLSLSDNKDDLRRCLLDTIIIPAKGYIVIWADESSDNTVGHASFRLTSQGEKVYLSNQYGRIIDFVEIPKLKYNTAYARIGDGGNEWGVQTPTCNEANENADIILPIGLTAPIFSCESGFYEADLKLEISADEGVDIYYTLDGSNPTIESLRYEVPIEISDASIKENVYAARTDLKATMEYVPDFKVDKGTVVRAMAYSPEKKIVSEIVTSIYFVGFGKKKEYEGYAVISLVTDPNNLFDHKKGIYCNGEALEQYIAVAGIENGEVPEGFTNEEGVVQQKFRSTNAFKRGKEWEREANIIYFDQFHDKKAEQTIGIRISGQASRNAAQKSFNLYAREIYDGSDALNFPFFEGMEYSSVKLRNGGSDYAGSKIYDAFLQSLAKGREVAIQDANSCVVFLNGEYWGIYSIREKYSEEYFRNHYGVDENDVWMLVDGEASIGGEKAQKDYDAMLEFFSENDMSLSENYNKACKLIDTQSLIDFYCIQLYVDNTDMDFEHNIAVWRSISENGGKYKDGKWRFILYDLDGSLTDPENNTFKESEKWRKNFDLLDEVIFSSLIKNERFKDQFKRSFQEIASTNFQYDRVHESLMQWKEQYQVQAVKSHQRFISSDVEDRDYEAYISYIDDFFRVRYDFMMDYLEEELQND